MQFVLGAAVGLATALALDASLPPANPATSGTAMQGTTLAARLAGKWTGRRTMPVSIKPANFTMVWRKAPDGHLTGTVAMPGQPKYPVNVVWSSDTAFIYESAPHLSRELHEKVVTRSVVHFKGSELDGTFEARPMHYSGKTISGHFTATRAA
jgi:hypothetical protein